MELWQEVTLVIVASLISPMVLKVAENIFIKNSEDRRDTKAQIAALGKRVDELRDKNVELMLQIGVVSSENKAQKIRINQLETEVIARDKRIQELEHQVDNLTSQLMDRANNGS